MRLFLNRPIFYFLYSPPCKFRHWSSPEWTSSYFSFGSLLNKWQEGKEAAAAAAELLLLERRRRHVYDALFIRLASFKLCPLLRFLIFLQRRLWLISLYSWAWRSALLIKEGGQWRDGH